MTASYQWDYPDPHVISVQVLPEHIDVMLHTNNVVYQQWLEAVAWAHSQALGIGPEEFQRAGHGMVVRRHELDYLAATHLGERILLATWLIAVDRLTTTRVYQFVREDTAQTVFRGKTLLVCVDIEKGRLRRMPPEFYQAYSSVVTPVVDTAEPLAETLPPSEKSS